MFIQGRHRLFESGTAIERRRRPPSAEGTSGGRTQEVIRSPLVRGVWGISPMKILQLKMTKEAILLHFETIFACETQLILQTL